MWFGSAVVAAALAVCLLTPAAAQVVDPVPDPSTPMVTLPVWQTRLPTNQLVTVSNRYVMHRRVWSPRNGRYVGWPIVRLSDGAVVSELTNSAFPGSDPNKTRLDGDALLLEYGRGDNDNGHVDVLDPETLALRGRFVAPLDERLLAYGSDWMFTLWWPTEGDAEGRLRFLDGHTIEVVIPNDVINTSSRVVGRVGSVVYLYQNFTLASLDLSSGTVTRLAGPGADAIRPYGSWLSPMVSGDRIVQLQHDWTNDTDTAVWYDAATMTEHRTPLNLPADGTLYPFGNDLVQAVTSYGQPKTLHPVDLDTGSVAAPLGQVVDVASDGVGGLVVTVDDEPDDALGVVGGNGNGVRRVAALPRVPEYMTNPRLDGDSLSALVDVNVYRPMSTSAQAPSAWVNEPRKFTTAGDVRLEEIPDPVGNPTSLWELSWPGGSRIIDARSVVLGHGGELVVVDGSTVQRVRPGADGSVEVASPFPAGRAVADGSWVWLVPGDDHVVRGFDADDPSNTRQVDPGVGCSVPIAEARDGFMLITCSLGWSWVIDLSGKLPIWRVPISYPGKVVPALGNGFVVWTYQHPWTPERDAYTELRVADLTAEHRTTVIGDIRRGDRNAFTADEAGGHRIAYVNDSGLVAVRDVTRPDATAPVAAAGALDQPELVASGESVEVHLAETWTDTPYGLEAASGLATVDVRTRTRTADTDWSPWQTTPEGAQAAQASVVVEPGNGVCFSSRARDLAGNQSAWSAPRCTVVDGTAPTLRRLSGPARHAMADQAGRLRVVYGASDEFGVATYDVQTRQAKPGGVQGPWTTRLSATPATQLSVPGTPGSEWCVRFRARDVAGNLTGWSRTRCTAVGYDDRALRVSGATARRRSPLALNRTVTVLKRKGASANLAKTQRGRTLAVWVLRGPDQGPVEVRVGATSLGRIRTSARTWSRVLVKLPLTDSGRVRFVAAGRRPVRLDGFAVSR